MTFEIYALPAVLLVTFTALILLISPDWRASISALAVQYIGVFILVALDWPLEMAVSKLVAGWMAGAVLGMAIVSLPRPASGETEASQSQAPEVPRQEESAPSAYVPSGRIFRLVAATLVVFTVASVAPRTTEWIDGIKAVQAWGSFILIGMGLLQLGFTAQPFRTILGILTVLAGFEILYAVVERSTLVAGLLAAVNLGVALVGAYLILAPFMEEAE